MSSQDSFGDITTPGPGPSSGAGNIHGGKQAPYQFNEEEVRVLRDCNRDSFFQRCMPIGTLLATAAYYGVKTGHLKASPRWGPTPKVMVAAVIGYFIGKISYQSKCAEKLMQLPDSRLGAILRQRKRGTGLQESLEPNYGSGMSLMPFSSTNPSDTYSDVGPVNSMDMDTTRPDQRGLDDSHRPSVDNTIVEDDTMPPMQKKATTYDELRKDNRQEFQSQRTGSYKGLPNPQDVPPIRRVPTQQPTDTTPPRITNKYGDVFD